MKWKCEKELDTMFWSSFDLEDSYKINIDILKIIIYFFYKQWKKINGKEDCMFSFYSTEKWFNNIFIGKNNAYRISVFEFNFFIMSDGDYVEVFGYFTWPVVSHITRKLITSIQVTKDEVEA